jgi:hypothetical protein
VLVRGLQKSLRPAPWSFHRTPSNIQILESVAATSNRPRFQGLARASIAARLALVDHSE